MRTTYIMTSLERCMVSGNSIVCPSLRALDKCVVQIHRFRGSAGIAMCIIKSVILGKNTRRDPCNHYARMIFGRCNPGRTIGFRPGTVTTDNHQPICLLSLSEFTLTQGEGIQILKHMQFLLRPLLSIRNSF
jgi:hypothetical protein